MSNGNPALAGSPPTDPNGMAENHSASGPDGNQSGINGLSQGNLSASATHYFSVLRNMTWVKTKGSKLEYGMAMRFEIVLGFKNSVTAGFKTALDIAFNRTYNLGTYTTLFGGARYELIRPKKIETVYGTKDDVATLPKKERVNGAWTHTVAAKEQKNQALYKAVVDQLMEESGATLEKIITKYDAKWTKVAEKSKSLKEQSDKLTEKIARMNMTIDNYKADIDKISDICKEFQNKSGEIDAAMDAALNIKTPKHNIKGAMVSMKAGTVKLMGSLVKLGE